MQSPWGLAVDRPVLRGAPKDFNTIGGVPLWSRTPPAAAPDACAQVPVTRGVAA
ncbi:MAG: hypothetical protein H0U56_09005 [Methylibium sp.]|uniref:hypothetical protein n=1 Tax=Methylibium sp. TaxID=2067992 RepID=UPI001817B7E3|nr:hypothetical protein [Methylibium sp.]MBA2723020.1 hypothetical protein [Methylibium sp.]MBA3588904.1 hypothetical protein [Methylibium sp.]